jgi:hypothetical protein
MKRKLARRPATVKAPARNRYASTNSTTESSNDVRTIHSLHFLPVFTQLTRRFMICCDMVPLVETFGVAVQDAEELRHRDDLADR